ncbi:hypothetical protein BDR05DRAFT_949881 [Suillus weaverae]|nr:hypothetical protein BDR05DRAFT_949881 [Suillus weaverae]
MAELDDDELEKAKETVEEWSNNCPPLEIQAQVAHKKGPVYIYGALFEGDVEAMWDESNEKGEVLFGMHDDNKALGDGDSFMKMKDWEDIEPVWQEYVQEQFMFKLEMDGEGMLLLPDIMDTKLEEKKAMVRAFLTSHYRICSGKDKAVVPWSAIIHSQDDFVTRMYLPADVDLKEPLKLQNWDTTALLQFWHARQERGEGPMFLFKAWKNTDGDMVPSVISSKSASPQAHIVRKQQRVTIRRPRDLSTEGEGDTESSTHHTEVDVDDDSADRRPLLKKPRTGVSAPKGTAVPRAIPKPRPAKPAKTGALLTSRMGDLLDGLTEEATSEIKDDVEVEDRMMAPEVKRRRGKKAVVEPSTRTTRSLQLVMSGAKNG